MTKTLYFAPINRYGNFLFRHIVLNNGADYVFSELIMADKLESELVNDKFRIIKEDLDKTIFQIGAGTAEQIKLIINKLICNIEILEQNSKNTISSTKISETNLKINEINLNMGCPQSGMEMRGICGGILKNKEKIELLSKALVKECSKLNIIPSIKLRIGTDIDKVEINDYLNILNISGIKKVYIHARTLRFPYSKPANYESLKNIKENFPLLQIIINGDIDSYNYYEKLTIEIKSDSLMIGRAALINPSIFNQIKNKVSPKKYFPTFMPELNDPGIIRVDEAAYLTEEKKKTVLKFLNLSILYNLRIDLIRFNLNKLLKGISGTKYIIKLINTTESVENTITEIEKLEVK